VASKKGNLYLRKRPYTYDNPKPSNKRIQALVASAAHRARGTTGTTTITKEGEEKEIPTSANVVREEMKGIQVAEPKPEPATAYKFLVLEPERLRALLRALARAR